MSYSSWSPEKKKKVKKSIVKLCITALIIGGIVLAGYLILRHFGYTNISQEQIQELISKTGFWAPFAYILICFLQVTFIPIPSSIVIFAGNYLFGPALSFLYSYIGIIFGSILAFFLGRWIGKRFVYWIAGDKQMVEDYLQRMKGKETVILFFMFLFPFFPDDILCSIAGITSMHWVTFLIIQLFTRITSTLINTVLGPGGYLPYDTWWGITILVILIILAVALFIYSYRHADKINDFIQSIAKKLKKDKQKEISEETKTTEEKENDNKSDYSE